MYIAYDFGIFKSNVQGQWNDLISMFASQTTWTSTGSVERTRVITHNGSVNTALTKQGFLIVWRPWHQIERNKTSNTDWFFSNKDCFIDGSSPYFFICHVIYEIITFNFHSMVWLFWNRNQKWSNYKVSTQCGGGSTPGGGVPLRAHLALGSMMQIIGKTEWCSC